MNTPLVEKIKELPFHGRLHCHSENSLKDSFNKIPDMAAKAKELGYDALALTDHGNIAGWVQHMKACQKKGIKPIFGVEAYVKDILEDSNQDQNEDDANLTHVGGKADAKLHLILIGLDDIGRKTVSLIVTESNLHIQRNWTNVYPCIDKGILEKYLAPGTEGHGHVVVTSACIGGVLAGRVYQNNAYIREWQSLSDKLKDHVLYMDAYEKTMEKLAQIKSVYDQAKMVKGKTYKNRLRVINAREDGPEKEKALAEIDREMQETEIARENFDKIRAEMKEISSQVTLLKNKLLPEETEKRYKTRCSYLEGQILKDDEMVDKLKNEAMYYDCIVGHGYFFIELQYHGLPMEKLWMPKLDEIAHELMIPTVASNDEHMINRDDTEARKYLNAMRTPKFTYEEPEETDYELYFKSDEELAEMLLKMVGYESHVYEAFAGISQIISMCDEGKLANGKHYPRWNNDWTKEETEVFLEKLARDGIAKRYPNWTNELEDRLQYELRIINSMGFTDYFLVVQWYINVGKKLGHMPDERFDYLTEHVSEMNLEQILAYIDADQSMPGYAVGPGRGSGAGSIVCYLTGITAIDPIRYNLIFERFLNPERKSMPDIDVDFSNHIRGLLIQIMKAKFGVNGVCGIMTRGTLAAKNSIKQVAKVYGSKTKGDPKFFLKLGDDLARVIPEKPGALLKDSMEDLKNQFGENQDAMEICKIARKLEGTYVTTGQHAAGVVLTDNGDLRQYTALFNVKDVGWVSQMDKYEVEEYGMLKFDFLGLINLDIITDIARKVYKQTGEFTLDLDNLPLDQNVMQLYRDADTNAIFQFESVGMKKNLKAFGPQSIEDLTILNAMYRPGPMDNIPKLIEAKNSGEITYAFPELKPILGSTYGALVYQEQVQQIFRVLAGYSLGDADLVRRAMAKKHKDQLAIERDAFLYGDEKRGIVGCQKNGYDLQKANALFEMMFKFAEYAFNLAHAAAYAYVSYITAYLKCHYPTEFYCTTIEYTKLEKVEALVSECRMHGINVKNPDVNDSEEDLSIVGNDIYFGLGKVKSVAGSAGAIIRERNEHGLYKDVPDFLFRTGCKKDVFYALIYAGAFDSLNPYRMDLIANAEMMLEAVGNITQARTALDTKVQVATLMDLGKTKEAFEANGGKRPVMKVLAKSIARYKDDIQDNMSMLSVLNEHNISDNIMYRLRKEQEFLGVYLSATPLDGYQDVAFSKSERRPLRDIDHPQYDVDLLMFPTDMVIRPSKSGKMYARFIGETKFGPIMVLCFEDNVIARLDGMNEPFVASGSIAPDSKGDGYQFKMKNFQAAVHALEEMKVQVKNVGTWADINALCEKDDGPKLYCITQWFDRSLDEIRNSHLEVSKGFWKTLSQMPDVEILKMD